MGATQVAEGPLIKHVPGGYAEWRAKESGLPPARLHSSEGEWWGKLVGPTDTTTPDPILGVGDSGVGEVGKGFTDDEKQGLDDPSFDTKNKRPIPNQTHRFSLMSGKQITPPLTGMLTITKYHKAMVGVYQPTVQFYHTKAGVE